MVDGSVEYKGRMIELRYHLQSFNLIIFNIWSVQYFWWLLATDKLLHLVKIRRVVGVDTTSRRISEDASADTDTDTPWELVKVVYQRSHRWSSRAGLGLMLSLYADATVRAGRPPVTRRSLAVGRTNHLWASPDCPRVPRSRQKPPQPACLHQSAVTGDRFIVGQSQLDNWKTFGVIS